MSFFTDPCVEACVDKATQLTDFAEYAAEKYTDCEMDPIESGTLWMECYELCISDNKCA